LWLGALARNQKACIYYLLVNSLYKKRDHSNFSFFFLDEKETKNQDLGFSAIKIGSLPKTQKLPRYSGSNSSSFFTEVSPF
jgi:hypothetical protein